MFVMETNLQLAQTSSMQPINSKLCKVTYYTLQGVLLLTATGLGDFVLWLPDEIPLGFVAAMAFGLH